MIAFDLGNSSSVLARPSRNGYRVAWSASRLQWDPAFAENEIFEMLEREQRAGKCFVETIEDRDLAIAQAKWLCQRAEYVEAHPLALPPDFFGVPSIRTIRKQIQEYADDFDFMVCLREAFEGGSHICRFIFRGKEYRFATQYFLRKRYPQKYERGEADSIITKIHLEKDGLFFESVLRLQPTGWCRVQIPWPTLVEMHQEMREKKETLEVEYAP